MIDVWLAKAATVGFVSVLAFAALPVAAARPARQALVAVPARCRTSVSWDLPPFFRPSSR